MTVSESMSSALSDYSGLLQKRLLGVKETEQFALPILARLESFGLTFGDVRFSMESGEFVLSVRGNIPGRRASLDFYGGDIFSCGRDDENQKETQPHEFVPNDEFPLAALKEMDHSGHRHEFLDFDRDENKDRTWHSVKWTQPFKQVTCEITGTSKEDLIEQILLSLRDFLVAREDAVAA